MDSDDDAVKLGATLDEFDRQGVVIFTSAMTRSLSKPDQDFLWKLNIPWTERLKVLKILDTYNVNALSLFDSEESLMETMALRTLEF